jgi:hypothetical protein
MITMYTAIVAVENNRISKFAEFEHESAALAHVEIFGGFVYSGKYFPNLWIDGQEVTHREDPVEVALRDYDIAIERHLDAEAEAAGYYDPLGRIPNIDRACAYAGFSNPYQAESQSFVAWRAEVWAYVYQVKSEVEAGTREQPTIEALLAELPARVAP